MQILRTVTSLDVSAVAGHHAMPAALLFLTLQISGDFLFIYLFIYLFMYLFFDNVCTHWSGLNEAKVAKGASMGTPSPLTKSALCLHGRGVAIDNTALVRFKRLV